MHYLIEHVTTLDYPAPIREHHIELRLAPRTDAHQQVVSCTIETVPGSTLGSYIDYFGNRVDYFCVIAPHSQLTTRMRAEVITSRANPFDFSPTEPAEQQEWLKSAIKGDPRLNDFVLHCSSVTPNALNLAKAVECAFPRFNRDDTIMNGLLELMQWVPTVLIYRSGATSVHADLIEAVRQGAGVCQDFAHLFITVARSWGVPTRYVMGYLDPGILADGEELATHAWAEALVPGGGWVGFDTTHGLLANDRYVAVAVGRDSYDAAPQRGSFKGDSAGQLPNVKVTVQEQ